MDTNGIIDRIKDIEKTLAELTKKQGGGGTALEKATPTEIKAGVDDAKYPTPAGLKGAGITPHNFLLNEVFNG